MVNSRRGRPVGGSDARERILEAAKTAFLADGYTATSVRSIAREAGVDHALVNYHFGSKHGLFEQVVAVSFSPASAVQAVFARPGRTPMQQAEQLLHMFLRVWEHDDASAPFLAVVREAITDDRMRDAVADFVETEVLAVVAEHVGGRDARRRAAVIGTTMSGLVFARYLLRVRAIRDLTPEEIVRTYAPVIAAQLAPRR